MQVIGVDIGGTTIKSAIVEVVNPKDIKSYKIIDRHIVSTCGSSGREVIVNNIVSSINHFDSYNVDTVCVSSAGTIDWDSGIVTYATDALLGFTGLELTKELTLRTGKKVRVINDAISALIAEVYYNNFQHNKVMMFTLGTGLGASLFVNDKLDNSSIIDTHLGHITLHENGRKCFCGKLGCTETYVSATGLKKNADNDDLKEVFSNKEKYSTAINCFYKDFDIVLYEAVKRFNPDKIIVGGGVVELKDLWWNDFISSITTKVDIITAKLSNSAGFLGAIYGALNGKFNMQ